MEVAEPRAYAPSPQRRFRVGEHRLQLSITVILLALWGLFVIGNPRAFLSKGIYLSFMSTIPFSAIMALGLTLVVIGKEIDLSFPSIMGLSGWVFTAVFHATHSTVLALVSALATGAAAGLLNGVLVTKAGIPSLVATVGTMFFWRGAVMILSGGLGKTLVPVSKTPLYGILVGRIGGAVPAQTVWTVVLGGLMWALLNRHKLGSHIYFTGDNADSARVMGIRVDRVKLFVFAQLGLLAAFSGILSGLEVLYYWPTSGEGYLLPTMAAVFVGGTSVFGGVGTIFGTLVGALIIGCLEAGIVAMGLTGFWTQLIYGLVIIISLSVYSFLKRRG